MNAENDSGRSKLISRLDRLHTTGLGAARIRKNLSLEADDVTGWCREQIADPDAVIIRRGKNWYVSVSDCVITVNASSDTMITAHRKRAPDSGRSIK